jgi:cytochrome c oxidase subunit 2
MRRIPEDAMKITVNAGKWYWKFTYPNGMEQNNDQGLTVPLGQPIQIDLVSDDVVHAFYVPAFRLKMDVMPKPEGAQINRTWFEATKIGSFDILCAEYCGLEHSQMLSKVHVIPQAEFETWVQETEKAVKAAAEENPGEALFQSKGCFACHTTDGTPRIGPSFKGLYGKQEQVLTNNVERTITVDEPYLINSMKNPNQDLVKGYQPVMPPQNLTDEEIQHLIQYIKSFSE